MFVVILTIILISNAMESREYRRDQKALRGGRKMKRFAVLFADAGHGVLLSLRPPLPPEPLR